MSILSTVLFVFGSSWFQPENQAQLSSSTCGNQHRIPGPGPHSNTNLHYRQYTRHIQYTSYRRTSGGGRWGEHTVDVIVIYITNERAVIHIIWYSIYLWSWFTLYSFQRWCSTIIYEVSSYVVFRGENKTEKSFFLQFFNFFASYAWNGQVTSWLNGYTVYRIL